MPRTPKVTGMHFLDTDIDILYSHVVLNQRLLLLTPASQTYVLLGLIDRLADHPLVIQAIEEHGQKENS